MTHRWGPIEGSRFPDWPGFFQGFRDMKERDVYYLPDPHYAGSEYRGTRSDGTLMRWVGVFGESISYDHTSKGSAQFFDKIIETLCWFEREF